MWKELNMVFSLQVIDWLDSHGDIFLSKNTALGKTLQRSKALQKSHEHFQNVAQVSSAIFMKIRKQMLQYLKKFDQVEKMIKVL